MSGTPVRNTEPLLRKRGFGARFGGGPTAPGRLRSEAAGVGAVAQASRRGREPGSAAGGFVFQGRSGDTLPPVLQDRKPGFGTSPRSFSGSADFSNRLTCLPRMRKTLTLGR